MEGNSSTARQKRHQVALVTVLVMLAPFFIWKAWSGLSSFLSNQETTSLSFPFPGRPARGPELEAPQRPPGEDEPAVARAVALAQATTDDLDQAFVFSDVRPLPDPDLIYVVQRHSGGRFEAHLIDTAGNWVHAVSYIEPNFSGDPADGLYPARENYPNNKWGYLNKHGDWAIPPQFDSAEPFANGMALVFLEKNFVFVDARGKPIPELVIHRRYPLAIMKDWIVSDDAWYVRNADGGWKKTAHNYKWVQPFNDHAVMVRQQDNRQLLLDRNGNPVTFERYDAAGMTDSHVALKDGKWGVLNAQGAWLVEPQFDFLAVNEDGSFRALQHGKPLMLDKSGKPKLEGGYLPVAKPSDGLTAACVELRCGYVDDSGNWAIAPRFDRTFAFSDGIARVILNGLVVYIDRKGNMLTPLPPFNAATPAMLRPETVGGNYDAYYGYIDRNGKYLLVPFYNHLGEFSENLAPVQGVNGRYGYVDPSGKWVIPPVFGEARNFSDGWALVKGAGVESSPFYNFSSYIDAQGHQQLVLTGSFQSAGDFKNGRAKLEDYGGKTWFIDKTGQTIPEGAAVARPQAKLPDLQRLSVNGGKWGYADVQDRFVIAPKFDEAKDFSEGFAAVKIDGLWGYINRSGKIVVQPAFQEAAPFSEGLARIKKEDRWSFIDAEGHAISDDKFIYAGDFHDGRAKVGLDLDDIRSLAAGIAATKMHETPNNRLFLPVNGMLTPTPYLMLSEGTDMRNGIAAIKLAPKTSNSLFALMDKNGEIIIPSAVPK